MIKLSSVLVLWTIGLSKALDETDTRYGPPPETAASAPAAPVYYYLVTPTGAQQTKETVYYVYPTTGERYTLPQQYTAPKQYTVPKQYSTQQPTVVQPVKTRPALPPPIPAPEPPPIPKSSRSLLDLLRVPVIFTSTPRKPQQHKALSAPPVILYGLPSA